MGVYEVQEHFREVVPTLNRAWEADTKVLLGNASLSHWQGETAVGFCGETCRPVSERRLKPQHGGDRTEL